MERRQHEAEWAELEKVDYFLEHVARAVERGEVPMESYERLSPRYLQRRSELVQVITGGAGAVQPSLRPPGDGSARADVLGERSPVETHAPLEVAEKSVGPVPRKKTPLSWTTVVTYAGAFLVVVAAAIFSVATWDLFSVGFRIAFLGGLTVAFYGVGDYVRSRLGLSGGGTALIAVSCAMLLFEGWIVIDGYSLAGPWPWAGLFLVCAVAYVAVEVRLRERWTGVLGAAAQLAWWWMMGQGLAWPTSARMAGVAVIGVVWAVSARRAAGQGSVATLAQVLRWAALVAAAVAFLGTQLDAALAPTVTGTLVNAAIVGLSATVIADATDRSRAGLAAIAYLPLVTVLSRLAGGPTFADVAVLAGIAVFAALYELWRGGLGHAVVALVAEASVWLLLADVLDWPDDVRVGVFVVLAVSWLIAGRMIPQSLDEDAPAGAGSIGVVATVGGWVLLVGATLAVPDARGAVPLSGSIITGRDVLLAVLILAAWSASVRIRRNAVAGVGVVLTSFWLAASAMAWLAPEWHSALYGSLFVVVCAIWLHGRRLAEHFFGMLNDVVSLAMRLTAPIVLLLGVSASSYYFEVRAWETVVLFAAVSLYALSDCFTRAPRLVWSFASTMIVGTGAMAGWVIGSRADAAVWAGATAVGLGLLGFVIHEGASRERTWWSVGSVVAASLLPLTALGSPGQLAVSLLLAGFAWWLLSRMAKEGLLTIATGSFFVLALMAAFEHFGVAPQAAHILMIVGAFSTIAAVAGLGMDRQKGPAVALAFTGATLVVALCGVSLASAYGPALFGPWSDMGEHGLAAALVAFGAYTAIVSLLFDLPAGSYVGLGALVPAVWVELGAFEIEVIEFYTSTIGLYLVGMGLLYLSRGGERRRLLPLDIGTALVVLALPALLGTPPTRVALDHALWALGLSLVAITFGVLGRVRAYFFGGVVVLVWTAFWRSWAYLLEFWWVALGLIGISMLVVALSWERQRMLVADASRRLRDTFEDWR